LIRKTLVIFVVMTALALLAIPLSQAVPWDPRNNDKFQPFQDTGKFNVLTVLNGDHYYTPSKEDVNKLVVRYEETFITYQITIGSHTYKLNEDFLYAGYSEDTFYDVTAWLETPILPKYVWPSEYRLQRTVVDFTFDFSAIAGGLDGTLHMRAVLNENSRSINSLSGTGDLQNVQIKATNDQPSLVGMIYTVNHYGIVSGWPE